MRSLTTLIAAFFSAAAASAHDYRAGDVVIAHPYAFETAATAQTGAGYLTITNTGQTDDVLLAVRADFPRVMIHTTTMSDGVASMSHVDGVPLPAGETVSFVPGGLHVMFMGLGGDPFVAGKSFPATLIFEQAGEVDVVFNIEARGEDGAQEMNHSAHQMGN